MPIWITSNIKMFSYMAVFAAGWYVHSLIADKHLRGALEEQQIALLASYAEKNKQTEGINNDYESKISALTKRINTIRLQQTKCVPIATKASNSSPAGTEYDRPHGVTDIALREFANDSEIYRIGLSSCLDFIELERK